jgi:hypothetical protein
MPFESVAPRLLNPHRRHKGTGGRLTSPSRGRTGDGLRGEERRFDLVILQFGCTWASCNPRSVLVRCSRHPESACPSVSEPSARVVRRKRLPLSQLIWSLS